MATLVLTAAGTLAGGPLGGAIGALIGQQADAAIFAPKPRHGPRLGDLAVQTSSYGSAIPRIFGTMRVAGTVIWSTELQERRSSGGGGKGRPKTVEYSYHASFAVALSGRWVAGVRRIWADGKLLRGAAGDFKSVTQFRLYPGDEDQAADPLIASVEGIGNTPAYRGIAYAVFEDLALADYGNRIPSLTFELVANEQGVSVGAIAAELAGGGVADGGTPILTGYAASGDSVRGAVADLVEAMSLPVIEEAGGLRIGESAEPAVIEAHSLAAPPEMLRKGSEAVPSEVSVAYYDPARDYQTGLQRAGAGPGRSERVAIAAVMDAGAAKAVAERKLAAMQAGRVTARLKLMPDRADIRPGRQVRVAGEPGLWRVERWTLDRMAVLLELVRVGSAAARGEASSGRVLGAPDLAIGATRLLLLDLPLGEEIQAAMPRLLVFAAGEGEGWRRATLSLSLDDGASWTAAGTSAAPAMMGFAENLLAPGGSALLDLGASLVVELGSEGDWLQSCTDDALARGVNLALVGDELIQFGSVEPLGGRRFRLGRLLRGRRGTEWASDGHVAGERFVLIEQAGIAVIDVPAAAIGMEARLRAFGQADGPDGIEARVMVEGAARRPPSPVHLAAERRGDGSVAISWVRRSRAGWAWLDGNDAPLGEEAEAYQVAIRSGSAELRVATSEPFLLVAAGALTASGLIGQLDIDVVQVGDAGPSRPASIRLP